MSLLVRILFAITLLLLTACAGKPVYDKDLTLKMLDGQRVSMEDGDESEAEDELAIKWRMVKQNYQALVETTENQQLKAMAMQRLADLALNDAQLQLEVDGGNPRQVEDANAWNMASADADLADSDEIKEAIGTYQILLKHDPDNEANARMLYQLAWAYDLAGELEKSLATLNWLHERYPDEENNDETRFRRGEILFSLRNYAQAEQAYGDVLQLGEESGFYGRALFKHGWSIYKQGDMQRALKSYFSLLDRSFADGREIGDFTRSEAEVLEDTLRIVSISFAYLGDSSSIGNFFQDYGQRSYEYRLYERLGELYLSQNRIEDASRTYLEFVDRYPEHKKSPLFAMKVVDIYEQARLPMELLAAKAKFVTDYGVGTPIWSTGDELQLAEMAAKLKANLQDLSSYYHARAQKFKDDEDYKAAAQWYRNYVQWFPEDSKSPYMNFLLAQSLQERGDLQAATQEFEYTAYQYPQHEKSAEAAYAALLAYRQQLTSLQDDEHMDKRQEAIASSRRFVTFFPADRRVSMVKTSLAEEFVNLKAFPDAVAMAADVIRNEPRPSQNLLLGNWEIIANGEFESGNYTEAESAILKLLEILPKDSSKRKGHLDRLAAAIYKQGEKAREQEDYRASAQHFLRLGSLVPESSIRINAEYDAAAAYYANHDWELAIPILQSFVESYPQHELRQGADEKLATLYEKQGDWLKAVGAYEVLYKNAREADKKRLLLWQIAQYYEKAGHSQDAINTYKRYVKKFRKPLAEAMEARQRLADIYKASNKIGERHWWLGQIIKVDKKGPSTERSHYLAAMASLELAQVKSVAFNEVRLRLPLKKNLKKKKSLMKDSLKAFSRAADYSVQAVTTESTYKIGEIYSSFSKGLFESERPKGLSKDELEQYDILLEEQAYPFEEKAIDGHIVNVQRASAGVYDEWVRKSFAALAKLNPGRYARTEKGEVFNEKLD